MWSNLKNPGLIFASFAVFALFTTHSSAAYADAGDSEMHADDVRELTGEIIGASDKGGSPAFDDGINFELSDGMDGSHDEDSADVGPDSEGGDSERGFEIFDVGIANEMELSATSFRLDASATEDVLVDEGGAVYCYRSGVKVYGERYIDGNWYYFDPSSNGAMLRASFLYLSEGEKWVYYGSDGCMLHGEAYVDGGWYLFDEYTGATTYGWVFLETGNKWVYYGPAFGDGVMRHGEAYVDGSGGNGWCFFDEETGEVYYGWRWVSSNGGKLVYYDTRTGRMRHGSSNVGGVSYSFNSATGALEANVKTFSVGVSLKRMAQLHGANMLDVTVANSSLGFAYGTDYRSAGNLQFLDLSAVDDNVTAYDLDRIIAQYERSYGVGSLHGCGKYILESSYRYSLNPIYFLSHAIIESACGTSNLSRGNMYNGVACYNYFGIHAFDSNPYNSGMSYAWQMGWTSPKAAIDGAAKWISGYYVNADQQTLYEMKWNPDSVTKYGYISHEYATSSTWAISIARVMASSYSTLGLSPQGGYVIPVYCD